MNVLTALSKIKSVFSKRRIYTFVILLFIGLATCVFLMSKHITTLKNECDKYKSNEKALIAQTKTYKTKDSLNAATAYEVQLKFDEYKKAHPDEKEHIDEVTKGRSLQAVVSVQGNTKVPVKIPLKDTVINKKDTLSVKNSTPSVKKDTIIATKDTVQTIKSYTQWYSIDGIIDKSFTGYIGFNESLQIYITVQYKRFLGFLWHTSKVKNRKVDVVSLNPYSKITNVEYTTITK
jgi:hypothetical protein